MAVSMVTLLSLNTKPVKAATTIPSNTDDNYSGGSWLGLRPQGPNELVNFNQTVTNDAVSSNNVAEAMLATRIYSLSTGSPDVVKLSFILNANSRHGVAYTRAGPESLPFPYGINTATNTGIHCNAPCGAWINIPEMVFYGAAGLSGYYNKVWVSPDGYISVLGPSTAGSLGPGVIAAFSRPLCAACGGNIWDWWDGNGGFFVAWDNVPSSSPESFLIWVHSPTNFSNSPFGESGIEFWYSSVTQYDGIPTAIGIADQYGNRVVSYNPTLCCSLNNQRLVFTATTGPKYLNSLAVSIADTSGGVPDSNAQIVLDPSTNPPGNPLGNNVLLLSTVPVPTVNLPDYSRTALAVAALTASTAGTAGLIFGTGVSLVDLGLTTYDTLVESYWVPKQLTWYSQTSATDLNAAYIHAWAAQDGAAIPNVTPVDASLAAKVIWSLSDSQRNFPHHLTITATVGYTDATYQTGPDTYTVTDSVQLDVNPDYKAFYDGFESGNFNPNNWVATGTWQVTPTCPLFNGLPNCIQGSQLAWSGSQSNELAPLILNLGNFVNYNQIVVYLHFWVSLNPGEQVTISYKNSGSWQQWTSYAGALSTTGARDKTAFTQWINARLVMPSTATAIGFTYYTGSQTPGQGFYMDDIYVFGDGLGNSADVKVDGQLTGTGPLYSVPVSMDSGPFYYTTDHFLETLGTSHTLTAKVFFTDNTGSYSFSQWLDGVTSASRTVTVSGTLAFIATYILVPDFTVTANPTSLTIGQGSSQTSTIYVTSRNGFVGSVMVTAYPPTGVSGISASPSSNTVSLLANAQVSYPLTITVGNSVPFGIYTVTVTGTGAGLSNSVSITVTVTCGGCGGGGSVASGTTITLADGSEVQVQNLRAGMQLLSYDTATQQFVATTITRFVSVVTNNSMVVQTTSGQPLIMDQNPAQKLYVMLPNGTQTMLSVTLLQPGYYLFNVPTLSWVQITSIIYQTGGNHIMYDIYNTSPGNYIANGYVDPKKT